MKHLQIRLGAVVMALTSLAVAARAEVPGRHPAYLHALSDLRYARALLDRPEEWRVAQDQHEAIVHIDHAIEELRRASWDDHKNVGDHPPIDAHWLRRRRISRAIEVLNRAQRDIEHEEDNPAAREWRNHAIHAIREAIGFSEKAARDEHRF